MLAARASARSGALARAARMALPAARQLSTARVCSQQQQQQQQDAEGDQSRILDKEELRQVATMEKHVRAIFDAPVKSVPRTAEEEAYFTRVTQEYEEKAGAQVKEAHARHFQLWLSMQRAFVALPQHLQAKADRPDLRFTPSPRLWMTTPPYKCYIERDTSLVDEERAGPADETQDEE